ncbi:MAG: cytochrome c [Vicinamibacteraceae bacterium]
MRWLTSSLVVLIGLSGMTVVVSADDAPVERGKAVYAAQKCSLCHTIAGVGKKTALDGVGTKLSEADIREWLVHPKEAAAKAKSTAKPVMKDYSKLPPPDIDALVAYMKTLTKK